MQLLPHIKNIYHLYLLDLLLPFCVLSSQENLYIIHHPQRLKLIINFVLPLFECIIRSSATSLERIKLITIVNYSFQAPDF